VLGLALLVSACDLAERFEWPMSDPPEPRSDMPRLPQLAPQKPAAAPPIANEVLRTVAGLRNTKLDLQPRAAPAQTLAFGAKRLAQLGSDALIVRQLPGLEVIVRRSMGRARAVIELVDGSFFVVDESQSYWLGSAAKKLTVLRRVPLLPGSWLLADRRFPQQLWTAQGVTGSLYAYTLDGSEDGALMLKTFFDLEEYDGRGLGLLKDGSFIYTTAEEFRRFFSIAKKMSLQPPQGLEGPLRFFSARRLDQVWIAEASGKLSLAQLGQNMSVVQSLELEPAPYDLDINDDFIATVHEERPARGERPANLERRWRLTVYDVKGVRRFAADLPGDPASGDGENWVAAVTRNKSVVLSRQGAFVAVGGATWLGVWNATSGEALHVP
jgi:hypothetical protein